MVAYIGQGGNISQRLPQSARQRDFWEIAVVITTADANFSAGHFLALEAVMISDAKSAGRVRLVNDIMPGEGAGALGEADRADIESFLEQARQVLPVLGLDLLRPQPRLTATPPAQISEGQVFALGTLPPVEFCIRRKDGMIATAREIDGEFVVLKDSQALKNPAFASNPYARLRSKLLSEGSLVDLPGSQFLTFARNVAFQSPSAAAAAVLDRNSNGRTEWKVAGTEETYDKWQTRELPL